MNSSHLAFQSGNFLCRRKAPRGRGSGRSFETRLVSAVGDGPGTAVALGDQSNHKGWRMGMGAMEWVGRNR